jgi:glutamine synthetase
MENFIEKEHLYDFINKMYNELKEMDIEIEGIKNQNTFFQINFNSLSKDVSIFCSNLLIKIRKQIE